jgi:hypothetical protein
MKNDETAAAAATPIVAPRLSYLIVTNACITRSLFSTYFAWLLLLTLLGSLEDYFSSQVTINQPIGMVKYPGVAKGLYVASQSGYC